MLRGDLVPNKILNLQDDDDDDGGEVFKII